MREPSSAARRFYRAFYQWTVLTTQRQHASPKVPSKTLVHVRPLSSTTSLLRGLDYKTGSKSVLWPRRDVDRRENQIQHSSATPLPIPSSQLNGSAISSLDRPFDTLKPWETVVRYRSDHGIMIETAIPADSLSALERRHGRSLQRLSRAASSESDEVPVTIDVGDQTMTQPVEGKDAVRVVSVIYSGTVEQCTRVHSGLLGTFATGTAGDTPSVKVEWWETPVISESQLPTSSLAIFTWVLREKSLDGKFITAEVVYPGAVWYGALRQTPSGLTTIRESFRVKITPKPAFEAFDELRGKRRLKPVLVQGSLEQVLLAKDSLLALFAPSDAQQPPRQSERWTKKPNFSTTPSSYVRPHAQVLRDIAPDGKVLKNRFPALDIETPAVADGAKRPELRLWERDLPRLDNRPVESLVPFAPCLRARSPDLRQVVVEIVYPKNYWEWFITIKSGDWINEVLARGKPMIQVGNDFSALPFYGKPGASERAKPLRSTPGLSTPVIFSGGLEDVQQAIARLSEAHPSWRESNSAPDEQRGAAQARMAEQRRARETVQREAPNMRRQEPPKMEEQETQKTKKQDSRKIKNQEAQKLKKQEEQKLGRQEEDIEPEADNEQEPAPVSDARPHSTFDRLFIPAKASDFLATKIEDIRSQFDGCEIEFTHGATANGDVSEPGQMTLVAPNLEQLESMKQVVSKLVVQALGVRTRVQFAFTKFLPQQAELSVPARAVGWLKVRQRDIWHHTGCLATSDARDKGAEEAGFLLRAATSDELAAGRQYIDRLVKRLPDPIDMKPSAHTVLETPNEATTTAAEADDLSEDNFTNHEETSTKDDRLESARGVFVGPQTTSPVSQRESEIGAGWIPATSMARSMHAARAYSTSPALSRSLPVNAQKAAEKSKVTHDAHIDPEQLSEDLKRALRPLTHPVVVITSSIPAKQEKAASDSPLALARGVTVSSFNTVSLTPTPIISFNLRVPSRSWDAISSSGRLAVHILTACPQGAALAHAFTQPYDEPSEPFHRLQQLGVVVSVSRPDGAETVPTLEWDGALIARFEATVLESKCINVGDHIIVVAEVYDVFFPPAAEGSEGENTEVDSVEGLSYAMRGYRGVGPNIDPDALPDSRSAPQRQATHATTYNAAPGNIPGSQKATFSTLIRARMYSTYSIPSKGEFAEQIKEGEPTAQMEKAEFTDQAEKARIQNAVSDPALLSTTVGDFFDTTHDLFPARPAIRGMMRAQKTAHDASNRLKYGLACGTLTGEESLELEKIITRNERQATKQLAFGSAGRLRRMLDHGRMDFRNAQWMETNIENGQAVLIAQANEVRQLSDEGKLDQMQFAAVKKRLEEEGQFLATELMRLRELVNEEDEGDRDGGKPKFDGFQGNV